MEENDNDELTTSFLSGSSGHHYMSVEDPDDDPIAVGGGDPGLRDMSGRPGTLREQDRFLPIANVARIMKKAIPKEGKIAKDARECVQECVSEFISFITSEASDRCHQEKRKTINGEDILFAMSTLGFDNYVEPLKLYLQKYRDAIKGEKTLPVEGYEEINDDTFSATTLEALQSGQNGQPNVIYAYPSQLTQSFQLG